MATTDELLSRFEKLSKSNPTQDVIRQATMLQELLAKRVISDDYDDSEARTAAGVDVAYDEENDRMVACAVIMDMRTRTPIDSNIVTGGATFPYISGLFSLREANIALDAIGGLRETPDVILVDGHGTLHSRQFGLACHVGMRTGIPTIGVAKNPHIRDLDISALGSSKGDCLSIKDGDREIGLVLRSKDGTKPLFVSVGHGISLERAKKHVLTLCGDFRQPETTRFTDHEVRLATSRQNAQRRISP